MSKEVLIRKSKQEDILTIAHRMRGEDVKEIKDSHGFSPYQALLFGVHSRGDCWTILGDDVPEAMMGVVPMSLFSNRGRIWLLGTDVLVKDKKLFVRVSKNVFENMIKGYSYLENYVSTENKVSLRWLERISFEFEEETIMMNDVPFKKFFMEMN